EQIFRLNLTEQLAELHLVFALDLGAETQTALAYPALNDFVEADKRSATNEQNVRRVDLQEILLRMLAAALRWNIRNRAFDDLQQGLLHTLARYITRNRGVVALTADLVDLVDVHDTALCSLDVVIGVLKQLHDDVLDVLTDVTGLRQRGRVGDGKRHFEDL